MSHVDDFSKNYFVSHITECIYGSPAGVMSHHLHWHVNQLSQGSFKRWYVHGNHLEVRDGKLMALGCAKNDAYRIHSNSSRGYYQF